MFEVPHAQAHYASRGKSSTVIQEKHSKTWNWNGAGNEEPYSSRTAFIGLCEELSHK
jgi:hypothetical protein